jgi:hypothetical protein
MWGSSIGLLGQVKCVLDSFFMQDMDLNSRKFLFKHELEFEFKLELKFKFRQTFEINLEKSKFKLDLVR